MWDGKAEMCNTALDGMKEPGMLLQMDSDELWTPEQLGVLSGRITTKGPPHPLFKKETHAFFWCRYFFGLDIVMTTRNCYANNPRQEWKRLWRFEPGMKFKSHEPPIMEGEDVGVEHSETEKFDLVFDHYGYALEKQVEFKERYYGYTDAVKQWRNLQANNVWPARLCDYLGWVKDENCLVSRI
jgi:hypothetical protein